VRRRTFAPAQGASRLLTLPERSAKAAHAVSAVTLGPSLGE
jgi:hypothetical protein